LRKTIFWGSNDLASVYRTLLDNLPASEDDGDFSSSDEQQLHSSALAALRMRQDDVAPPVQQEEQKQASGYFSTRPRYRIESNVALFLYTLSRRVL
jgi:hypothetical protein